MKRFITILLTALLAINAFAYEPKKECAKVKRNGNVEYYEKTSPYNYSSAGLEPNEDCVKWVIRKGYTVEQLVDYTYERLEKSRRSYYFYMKKAIQANPDDSTVAFARIFNEDPEERETKTSLGLARKEKARAATCLVFVTEENFTTLTKEEMLAKMNAFISDCTN